MERNNESAIAELEKKLDAAQKAIESLESKLPAAQKLFDDAEAAASAQKSSAVELAEAGKQALNIATQGLGAAARGFRKLIDKPDPSVPIVVRAEPIPVSPEDTEEAEIDLPEQEGGDVVGAVIPTKLAERTKQE